MTFDLQPLRSIAEFSSYQSLPMNFFLGRQTHLLLCETNFHCYFQLNQEENSYFFVVFPIRKIHSLVLIGAFQEILLNVSQIDIRQKY